MKRGSRGLHLDYAALYARYQAGESTPQIAASIGIDQSGLARSWARRGFVMRSPSERARIPHETPGHTSRVTAPMQQARRGAVDPIERKEARARTREARMTHTSALEDRVAGWLDEVGIGYVRQKAIGPYNVDFALDGGLVIEVHGGGHNPRVRAKAPERRAYIESHGWTIRTLTHRQVTREALHEATTPG